MFSHYLPAASLVILGHVNSISINFGDSYEINMGNENILPLQLPSARDQEPELYAKIGAMPVAPGYKPEMDLMKLPGDTLTTEYSLNNTECCCNQN
jgi:hypothetical protein